jgi:hypothetical protein
VVIYCHFKVIPSYCTIELFYLGNYHGIAVNYHGICVTNKISVQYFSMAVNYCGILTLEKERLKLLW